MEEDNLYLIYVKPLGMNASEQYEYEFFFSETPDIVWGQDWNVACPSACGDLTPDENTYSVIKRLKTIIPFFCAQQNSCFSMQDCIDHIIALAWIEDTSLILHFGENIISINKKIKDNENICSFFE